MFPESSHYWSCCLKIFLSPLKHARWSEKSLAHVKNWYHYQLFKRNPKKYSLFHWFPLSLRAHIVFILFKVMLKFCFLLKWSDWSWQQKMIFLRPGLFPDVRKKLYSGLIRLPDVNFYTGSVGFSYCPTCFFTECWFLVFPRRSPQLCPGYSSQPPPGEHTPGFWWTNPRSSQHSPHKKTSGIIL